VGGVEGHGDERCRQPPPVLRRDPSRLDPQVEWRKECEREAWRVDDGVTAADRGCRPLPGLGREVKAEVVPVTPLAAQSVSNDPVFVPDEQDPARVDGLIDRAPCLAAQHVESGRTETLEEPALGDGPSGPAQPVGSLVEAIDAHGVVGVWHREPAAPVGRLRVVRLTSGTDHARSPPCRNSNVKEIVVSWAAVAERTAVEDEEPLVTEGRLA